MAFKFVIMSCLVALARAGNIPAAVVAQPAAVVAQPVAPLARLEELDAYPQYSFGYDVADANTGDFKSQVETRNGDLVQGRYSLLEPDGNTRVVEYTADSVNGFNAVVSKPVAVVAEPARIAAAPVAARYTVATPVAAAPVAARLAAPLAAPVATPFVAPARYTAYPTPLSPYTAYPAPFARLSYPASAPIIV